MDFQSLKIFLRIAETGSFSAAGEQLFLTQPAVSKRMANLEAELHCRLFDRIGRQVRLTEAGHELLPRAKQLLNGMQDLQRALDQLSDVVTGTLSMGTSHHIGLHRLPPVLKSFTEQYPDVELDIRFLGSEIICQEVAHGNLELGIVTLPSEPQSNLRIQPLWTDRLHIVVNREHPLADAQPTLAELLRHPAVLPSPGTYTREILEQALGEQRSQLQAGICTDYLETLKMLAASGLGWALLPHTMLDAELRSLQIPGLNMQRRLGVITHPRHTLSKAADAMISLCRCERD